MTASYDQHIKYLKKLCRLCGGILSKDPVPVCKFIMQAKTAFHIDLSDDKPEVHPPMLCMRCYTIARNVNERETTTTLVIKKWQTHDESCSCYGIKRGRRTKKVHTGRPSTENNIWTRPVLNILKDKTPVDVLPNNILLQHFDSSRNPHINSCICKLCHNILRRPIIIRSCEHAFCLECLFPRIEGKSQKEVNCFTCNINFNNNDLQPSKLISNILTQLVLSCVKNCGAVFPVSDISAKTTHEKHCYFNQSSPTTVMQILSLTPTKEISREIEDAALHVVKQKMAKTNSRTIEFKSGGPRVS